MSDMIVGQKYALSDLHEGDVGSLDDQKFIVSDRYPEDRVSGGTEITYESGIHKTHVWDRSDPKVTYLGKGELVTIIRMADA